MNKRNDFLMFIIGLFSITQIHVVGSIAISELLVFFLAPFVLVSQMALFKRDRCMKFIGFCAISLIGCIIVSLYHHISLYNFLRGFATPYGFVASFIVLYPLLRKNPGSFSWYLVGAAFSMLISSFVFQNAYEILDAESRGGGVEGMMSGPIFWISRIGPLVTLPVRAFYLSTPILYSILVPMGFSMYSLFSTASGRSSALLSFVTVCIIAVSGKNQIKMRRIKKNFMLFLLGGIAVVFLFKNLYSSFAESGRLGEDAHKKYESQTRGGTDILHLVMGGRGEFFLGIYYVLHRPIMGYGPWAIDEEGLYLDYLKAYGLAEDYDSILRTESGGHRKVHRVGAHSAMLQFWLAYGIFGVPVWIYILYLVYDYFKRRVGVVPEFFGYFAFVLPESLWSAAFSPFGGRMAWGFVLAMLLLNRVMSKEREWGGPEIGERLRYDFR